MPHQKLEHHIEGVVSLGAVPGSLDNKKEGGGGKQMPSFVKLKMPSSFPLVLSKEPVQPW
jgi:hypothetical protein